jgi:patatin-related protein
MAEAVKIEQSVGLGTQKVEIALVMNGGVSLAVWIGGVAAEVYRAVRGDGLYGDLLKALDTRVSVDVITGASAGGLNGAFFAAALSRNLSATRFDELREVWLQAGSFQELLRDPLKKNPPSLLKGDEYFRPQIEQVLLGWFAGTQPVLLEPFDLVLTATTLDALPFPVIDSLGTPLIEPKTRAEFRFTGDLLCPTSGGLMSGDDNVRLARQLALAARTSASFPGAFEPSFVNVGGTFEGRVDMAGVASFDRPMWTVDGGVLVNKPVGPALDLLAQRPTDPTGRRLMLYVNPSPGSGPVVPAEDPAQIPSMLRVVRRSLVDLPQMESIAGDLDAMRRHNQDSEGHRRMRESLLLGVRTFDANGQPGETMVDLVDLADRLYPVWLKREGFDVVARRLRRRFEAFGGDLRSPVVSADGTTSARFSWNAVSRALTNARGPAGFYASLLPPAIVASSDSDRSWQWGAEPLIYGCEAVLDLLGRALRSASDSADVPAVAQSTKQLAEVARTVQTIRVALGAINEAGEAYWDDVLRSAPAYRNENGAIIIPPADAGYEWADQLAAAAYERWPIPPPNVKAGLGGQIPTTAAEASGFRAWRRASEVLRSDLTATTESTAEFSSANVRKVFATLATNLATAVADSRPALDEIVEAESRSAGSSGLRVLRGLIAALVPSVRDNQVWLRFITSLYIVHSMTTPPGADTPIEFVLISADTPSPLDPTRIDPTDKVTGLQLGHFGAFLKESWRANDWMWGRLDGAARLVAILLDPRRVRTLHRSSADAVAAFAPLMPKSMTPADLAILKTAIKKELAYLDPSPNLANGDPTTRIVRPQRLLVLENAVITAFQERIAAEELPAVASAIMRSAEAGGELSAEAKTFVDKLPVAPAVVSLDRAGEFLRRCPVGRETIVTERQSELLAMTASTAAAVASTALTGRNAGIGPIRGLLGTVRSVLLVAYVFLLNAIRRTKTASALTTLLLGIGSAIILARILGAHLPSVALLIAIALMVTWVALITLTVGAWKALLPIGIAVLVVSLSAIDRTSAKEIFDPAQGKTWKVWLQWGSLVVAAVIGVACTIAYARRWRSLGKQSVSIETEQRLARFDAAIKKLPEGNADRIELELARSAYDLKLKQPQQRARLARLLSLPISLAIGALFAASVWAFTRRWNLMWLAGWFDWANRWRPLVVIVTISAVTAVLSWVREAGRTAVRVVGKQTRSTK